VPVVFVGNASQSGATPAGVEVVTVGDQPDAADFVIVNRVSRGDIVVTDDIGLASLALPRGARCVSSRGRVFDEDNIGPLMTSRWIGQQVRAAGGRTAGPAAFRRQDRDRFLRAFAALLD
jgi:uncharacterized protein YaiI (UPF0178 family)